MKNKKLSAACGPSSRQLVRELVREVVIAGEVDISDLYADYRPADAKAYLGMVPSGASTAPTGGGAALDDTDEFLDAPSGIDDDSSNEP